MMTTSGLPFMAMSARADAQVPAVPDDVDDPRHEKASGVVGCRCTSAGAATRAATTELIELAESKDTGFDRRRFLDALASFRRFTSADLQVSPEEHERLEGVVST
jgi:hypothetical protein